LTKKAIPEQFFHIRIFVLIILLFGGGWRDLSTLSKFPTAVGVDGYYYVVQLNNFFSNGQLYFSTKTPLVIYFLAGITYFTENSVLAVKVGSVLLNLMLCIGIFALTTIITKSTWMGIIGSAIAIISGLHFFMIVEFISYLGAITLIIWFGFFLIKAIESKQLRWLLISIIFLLLGLFSHRATFLICLTLACMFLIVWLMFDKIAASKLQTLTIILILCSTSAILKILFLPDSSNPSFDNFGSVIQKNFRHLAELILLGIAAVVILLLFQADSKLNFSKSTWMVVITLVFWSFLIIINPFFIFENGLQTIVGRIKVLAYIQAAILAPIAICLILQYQKKLILYVVALITPLMLMSTLSPLPAGLQAEYMTDRQQLLQSLSEHRQQLQNIPIIIAPHGEQFLVTHVLNIQSQQRPPEKGNYESVYWLIHYAERKNINGVLAKFRTADNNYDTIIIEEESLFNYLQSLDSDTYQQLISSNDHLRIFKKNSLSK
jgi:hypothetical protein